MVSGCCTYALLFGLNSQYCHAFSWFDICTQRWAPTDELFHVFSLLIPRATKLGVYWSHLQPCMYLLSRCLCAWCAWNLSLASSLHSATENFAIRPGLLAHRELEFLESQFDCLGQNHKGGFQLSEAILYSSVIWSVESFSDQTCTWCIDSRQKAKKLGVYWHCNWVHNGGSCATQGNKLCCICLFHLIFYWRLWCVISNIQSWDVCQFMWVYVMINV